MLTIWVLGSAASGGFPQCRPGSGRRSRHVAESAILVGVSTDGEHWFLMEASPDVRQQIERTPRLHPQGRPRHSPIAGVVLTNADIDHVAGLLTLREGHPLSVYAIARVHQVLSANSIFNVLDADRGRAIVLPIEREIDLQRGR